MPDLSVSWLPFVVVAIVNFFLSWIWYSPTAPWFKAWAAGVGMDLGKKEMTEAEKKAMPLLMGGALVASFLLAWGLQVVVHGLGATSFGGGALVGLVAWLAFALTQGLNARFEGRKDVVLVINLGLYLLTYVLFGALVAVWR